ncbi:glycoside hydrolase family protein [Lelliottia wanjuensis]|uniref:glycoside hydrolase family protein n=1 Tax=Lelliottia wanjuensis TaxID=3050585 RepID=UPI00254BC5CD|nr:glycoside hydrolase family protein [Lelliottia sp. V106_16]MDK9356736.1 glycoside hydrolase family protein [Lelliottia sp. V106_16]
MNQKSEIIPLLRQEEGVRYTPYIDSLGYPTTGIGFKLGPQGAPLSHYTFTLSDNTINAWLQDNVDDVSASMQQNADIAKAMAHCNQPRQDILTSMAYQMGVGGLAGFHNMLSAIDAENWSAAASQMLDSSWAKQTPDRAKRHAAVMTSGQWSPTYDF